MISCNYKDMFKYRTQNSLYKLENGSPISPVNIRYDANGFIKVWIFWNFLGFDYSV